jgi:hypothetical protein
MKKNLLLIFVMCVSYANAQKQNIDVDLLSNIVSAKQDELKTRVLSNIVVKNIQTTNYTTYNTIYNLVDIITTEKNKTVMTQSIVHQIADYALVVGLSDYFIKKHLYQEKSNQFLKLTTEISTFEKSNFTKLTGLSQLMKDAYSYKKENENNEQTEKSIDMDKKNKIIEEEIKWNNLLANYLIDTAYQVLSKNTTLQGRGFFKQDPQRQFFRSGLEIDYTGVRQHFNENKRAVLDSFIVFLNGCTSIADKSDSIAKFVTENRYQFKDFGKASLSKEQLGFVMYLFNESIGTFREQIGKNNFIATIGDIISKYVIFDVRDDDPEKVVYDFKIDVEAIILAFEDKFYAANISSITKYKIGVKPFFTIGLNYGYFVNQNNSFNFDNNSKNLTQIALASEKVGVKFIFSDFKYTRSHPPLEWYKYRGSYRRWLNPVAKPLINNFYGMIYGSGILYNIVNLKSETNFNYAITGAALGLEFFNGLEFNLGYAMPIVPKDNIGEMLDKGFINIGFDIPIFEYLKAARDKRN